MSLITLVSSHEQANGIAVIFFLISFSAVTSWLLLYMLLPWLRVYILAQPTSRSSHKRPTPVGGGLVFVVLSSIVSFFSIFLLDTPSLSESPLLFAPLLALPLAIVGFLDDCYSLPVILRASVQFSTSCAFILVGSPVIPCLNNLPFLVLIAISISAIINCANFMDGLDGLLAGCMTVVISVAAFRLSSPLPIWALIGSMLGFLFWNWSPAKVFMGDVGSTFLGAVFALIVFQAPTWSEALSLLLVATPLLADAGFCIFRRLLANQPIFQPHNLHLFQRLHQAGLSHSIVSMLYIAATLVLATALFLNGLPGAVAASAAVILFGIFLDIHVATPFVVPSQE